MRFQQFNQQRHAKVNARRDKQEGAPYLSVQYQCLPQHVAKWLIWNTVSVNMPNTHPIRRLTFGAFH
jgi:hypothetical protein